MPPITDITFSADEDRVNGAAILATNVAAGAGVMDCTTSSGGVPAGTLVVVHFDNTGGAPFDSCGNATVTLNETDFTVSAADPLYGAASLACDNTDVISPDLNFSVSAIPAVSPAYEWTVEAWFMVDSVATGDCLLVLETSIAAWSISIDYSVNQLTAQVTSDGGASGDVWNASGIAAPALVAGTYFHVAVTWDGTAYRVYIDGTEIASQASALAVAAWDTVNCQWLTATRPPAPATITYTDELRISNISQYPNGTAFVPAGPFLPT